MKFPYTHYSDFSMKMRGISKIQAQTIARLQSIFAQQSIKKASKSLLAF